MIKVLTIGTDRNLFREDSNARLRIRQQGQVFSELHIIVFSLRTSSLLAGQIADNVWVYPTNSKTKFHYIRDSVELAKKIIAERKFTTADSVVSAQDPFESGMAASRISAFFGLRLHIQIHTDVFSPAFRKSSFLNRIRFSLARSVLPEAHGIRAVSARVAESIKRSGLPLKAEPTVLPVYADLFKYSRNEPAFDLHKKYPDFKFILLMVGRFSEEKDYPLALKAFRESFKKHPELGMVIVGDGKEREKLNKFIVAAGLSKNIVLENWQEDLVAHYKTADALLHTSKFEGYGLVLVEAAASGTPIITTDVGVARELVKDEFSKIVCPPDAHAISEAINELIEKPLAVKAYRDSLSKTVGNFWFGSMAKYLEAYKQGIESSLRS